MSGAVSEHLALLSSFAEEIEPLLSMLAGALDSLRTAATAPAAPAVAPAAAGSAAAADTWESPPGHSGAPPDYALHPPVDFDALLDTLAVGSPDAAAATSQPVLPASFAAAQV